MKPTKTIALMRKFPTFDFICLIAAITILFNVNVIIYWNNQFVFENYILPEIPDSKFENFSSFGKDSVKFDQQLISTIWLLITCASVTLIFLHFKLLKVRSYSDKKKLLKFFVSKYILYTIIFCMIPLNFTVLATNPISAGMTSISDKIAFAMLLFAIANIFSLTPYLAQKEINVFINFKDVALFNVGVLSIFAVLLYFNVSPFISASISGLLMSLPFAKKMKTAWNEIEVFFDIKGKGLQDIF